MELRVTRYAEQEAAWPETGRHILAQYDAASVVVYQAYKPSIGRFAVENGYFGGEFRYTRMSWCKPNFLWMMYRSGWGTKEGQETTLAVRLKRSFFDILLAKAVPSSYDPQLYPDRDDWSAAVAASEVRLQWDPDHDPVGVPLLRRAIQLGLRGAALESYGRDAILSIEDISDFVSEQRAQLVLPSFGQLMTPTERVYRPEDSAVGDRLHLQT